MPPALRGPASFVRGLRPAWAALGPRVRDLAARAGAEARAAGRLAAEARAFVAPRLPAWLRGGAARHAASRLPALALFAFLAARARLDAPGPPERTREGVAAMLSAVSGGEVGPADFVWEKSGGALADLALGRRLLFIASLPGDGGRGELFRARARLTRGGRPIGVAFLENLSESPLGDERALTARGSFAAHLVLEEGRPSAVVALDFTEAPGGAAGGLLELLSPGVGPPARRIEVRFDEPPPALRFELQGEKLVLALGEAGTPAAVTLGPEPASLALGEGPAFGARAQSFEEIPPGGRGLGERLATGVLGPRLGALAVAEAARLSVRLSGRPAARAPEPASGPPWEGSPFDVSTLEAEATSFSAVSIDLGRGWLSLEPGRERPRSPFGVRSDGEIPEGALGVFNAGAPSPRRGGFVASGRVFAELVPGLASVRLEGEGVRARVALGPLPEVPAPEAFGAASFLQATEGACGACRQARSALCLASEGGLVYLWASDATAADLEAAAGARGCARWVPLAAGRGALGFARLSSEGALLAADRAMPIAAGDARAAREALGAGDFFAVHPMPAAPAAPLPPGVAWAPDGGAQPAPLEVPAAHAAEVGLLGAEVRLSAFAPDRFGLRIEPGSEELRAKLGFGPPRARPPNVLAAIGLGASRRKAVRGLSVAGEVGLPFHDRALVLLVDPASSGRPTLELSDGFLPPASADATELPILAEDGKLRLAARRPAERRRRGALCVLEDGTLLVATSTYDSDEPNAQALLDAGCARVASLERGEKRDAFIDRAGLGAGIAERYGSTSLILFEAPAPPRARGL